MTGSGNNYGRYSNPAFDDLIHQAQNERDAAKRGALLNQAEQLALNDNAIIPVLFMKTRDLVQPYVRGWVPNIRDFNRSRWLWIDHSIKPER
ncbi:MAG: hypothetical protein J0H26_07330 [Alphaproteobacteria bacterium]|nr:hypothetical protein [Alphaproteobacteria bacterium]